MSKKSVVLKMLRGAPELNNRTYELSVIPRIGEQLIEEGHRVEVLNVIHHISTDQVTLEGALVGIR